MTTVVQAAPRSPDRSIAAAWTSSMWFRRLMVIAVGCLAMAAFGGRLARYLDTAAVAGEAAGPPADAPSLN